MLSKIEITVPKESFLLLVNKLVLILYLLIVSGD